MRLPPVGLDLDIERLELFPDLANAYIDDFSLGFIVVGPIAV